MRNVGALQESQRQTEEVLKRAIENSTSDGERMGYSLRLAVEPAWSTWIKESGATTAQITLAIVELSAALMAETAQNVAKPGMLSETAAIMGEIAAKRTVHYATKGEKLAEVAGFHRRDS